jgi:hypothetical protein
VGGGAEGYLEEGSGDEHLPIGTPLEDPKAGRYTGDGER